MISRGSLTDEEGSELPFEDSDTASVFAILRGATRGKHDPDTELMETVARLRGATEAVFRDALARLIRDAHPD